MDIIHVRFLKLWPPLFNVENIAELVSKRAG